MNETTILDAAPAPAADVMTPEVPERAPPAREFIEEAAPLPATLPDEPPARAWENMPKDFVPSARDSQALFEATARLCRLRGYADHFIPSHAGDIDMRGLSPEVAGLIDFARKA